MAVESLIEFLLPRDLLVMKKSMQGLDRIGEEDEKILKEPCDP